MRESAHRTGHTSRVPAATSLLVLALAGCGAAAGLSTTAPAGRSSGSLTPPTQQTPPWAPAGFVCTSLGSAPVRTWTFVPAGDTWQVTHVTDGVSGAARLVLPNAKVTRTPERISLRARTANGGIDVTLEGPWEHATLDAYVNYELEVNVDSSLTPDIDDISTELPVGVRCANVDREARIGDRGSGIGDRGSGAAVGYGLSAVGLRRKA